MAELLIMVTVMTMILPAAALIREQERGTIEHLLVTPISPTEIMLAKVWSNALVVQIACLLSLLFVVEGYLGVPLVGSKALFLVGTLVYQFTATAIGMVLATIVRTVPQFVLAMLVVLAPMIFLSCVFTPTESIHPTLANVMVVLPLRYYVDLATAILFRGGGLEAVLHDLAAMAAIGDVLFALALARFRAHFSAIVK